MTIFNKLNLKDQQRIVVLDAPASFESELAQLDIIVARSLDSLQQVLFALAFVTSRAQIERISAQLTARAAPDAVLWFAYPKKSSKRYRCDFSRDSGWEPLGVGVRMVAIDEDWSALRFRHVDYVGKLSRDPARALSKLGKAKTRRTSD